MKKEGENLFDVERMDMHEASCALMYSLEIGLLRKNLKYQNRFFVDSYFFKRTKDYVTEAINNVAGPLTTEIIYPKQNLYRARLYNKHVDGYIADYDRYKELVGSQQNENKQFYGFSADESLAPPPDKVTNGRLNPQYIQVLYTSTRPYTALAEVRPIINSHVSIAVIKVKEPLKILRISSEVKLSGEAEDDFLYCINRLFSTPLNGTFEDYLPVQFISEYIKSTKQFDGIGFQSSLDRQGLNIVIFDQNKCDAIGSKLYLVNKIELNADCLDPYDGSKLDSKTN